jgi:hypothetical protein
MDLQKYVPQEFVFNGHVQMIIICMRRMIHPHEAKTRGPFADKGPLSKNRD